MALEFRETTTTKDLVMSDKDYIGAFLKAKLATGASWKPSSANSPSSFIRKKFGHGIDGA